MHYDAFNGDADGIASVVQLRLADPRPSTFVTGTKRDVALLARVPAGRGDSVTVLDISAHANREALERLVQDGVQVEYFDHHYAGTSPLPAEVACHIDTSPDVCTGMLVDRHLGGAQRPWAVVAAFGDNLIAQAHALAAPLALDADALATLRDLGDALTHSSYSDRLDEAIVAPAQMARLLIDARDPLRFARSSTVYATIDAIRRREMALARDTTPAYRLPGALVHVLPDAGWSRRVRGLFGNELANEQPEMAHAVATLRSDGDLMLSVRAPRSHPYGADRLCREFGGSGREAAAGIGSLPAGALDAFVRRLAEAFPGQETSR